MAEEPEPTSIEYDPATGGVKVKGAFKYEDIRPLILTTVDGVNNCLKIVCNTLGIPFDWANGHLERFRTNIRRGFETIPADFQQLPQFRITHRVLTETVINAEMPELQDLFAQLLITAADSRTASDAHPGFASTIAQLTPFDAEVLSLVVAADGHLEFHNAHKTYPKRGDEFAVTCANLCRLGITQWKYYSVNPALGHSATQEFGKIRQGTVTRFPGTSSTMPQSPGITPGQTRSLSNAARFMVNSVAREIEKTQHAIGIELTQFGVVFCRACLSPPAGAGENR